jgi:hypothetical protein
MTRSMLHVSLLAVMVGCWPSKIEAAGPVPATPQAVAAAIDQAIDRRLAEEKVPASPQADDATFLRRAYLDITGRIPSVDQALAFLDSTDPDKRRKLIDELLASPQYGQHFGNIWHDLIAPRQMKELLNEQPIHTDQLARWLADQFNQNRGWDAIVTDFLTAEGTPAEQPAMVFVLVNGNAVGRPEPRNLARSSARLFLGLRQLECAECHDAPSSDWKQADFWGLAAFFGRLTKDGMRQSYPIYEAMGRAKNTPPGFNGTIKVSPEAFINVGQAVKAKYLNGSEPELDKSKPFRPTLAAWVTSRDNPYLAPAAVNRLWGHFFGRGLVNPVDDLDENNAPSHPPLLTMLANELAASNFDLKNLIRCICNSRAYQRGSQPLPANKQDQTLCSRHQPKPLSPQVLVDSLALAVEKPDLFPTTKPAVRKGQPPILSQREQFVLLFSTRDEQDEATEFTHGIVQALSLMNRPEFNAGSPLVERLLKSKQTPEQNVTTLYLATLARRPTANELALATAYLRKKQDPGVGLHGILWSLLNRNEFIFNH